MLARLTALEAAPTLETDRLILRGHGLGDFDDLARMRADPEVSRFIGGVNTPEEVWARLLRYAGHWRLLGFGFWAVCERASGAYVGDVGLMDARRPLPASFGDVPEVGWALASGWQGKGFAGEAVQAALAWSDRHLDAARTVCIIDPDNAASLALAARCGFHEYGRADYHGEIVMLERPTPNPG